jgi:hypothetical protein
MERCPGARFSAYVVFSSPALPEPISATGSGAINAETDRSRITLDMDTSFTGPVHIVTLSDGKYDYTSGDTVEDVLPPGKAWVRTKNDAPDGDRTEIDFEDSMRMLSVSGGVRLVGRESVDGKMTRRYRSEVQVGAFVDFLRKEGKDDVADAYERIEDLSPTGISAESWIDRRNMLRRLRMVMPMAVASDEPPLTLDMRMDLFDYGVRPDIQLPDPGIVFEGPLDFEGVASSGAFS